MNVAHNSLLYKDRAANNCQPLSANGSLLSPRSINVVKAEGRPYKMGGESEMQKQALLGIFASSYQPAVKIIVDWYSLISYEGGSTVDALAHDSVLFDVLETSPSRSWPGSMSQHATRSLVLYSECSKRP